MRSRGSRFAEGIVIDIERQRSRRRWVITVTSAETIGYLAPATAGIVTTRLGLDGFAQAALKGPAAGVLSRNDGTDHFSMLARSRAPASRASAVPRERWLRRPAAASLRARDLARV